MAFVIAFFMVMTVLALGAGLVLMVRGGNLNAEFSNKLMVLRVSMQAVVILALAAVAAMSS